MVMQGAAELLAYRTAVVVRDEWPGEQPGRPPPERAEGTIRRGATAGAGRRGGEERERTEMNDDLVPLIQLQGVSKVSIRTRSRPQLRQSDRARNGRTPIMPEAQLTERLDHSAEHGRPLGHRPPLPNWTPAGCAPSSQHCASMSRPRPRRKSASTMCSGTATACAIRSSGPRVCASRRASSRRDASAPARAGRSPAPTPSSPCTAASSVAASRTLGATSQGRRLTLICRVESTTGAVAVGGWGSWPVAVPAGFRTLPVPHSPP